LVVAEQVEETTNNHLISSDCDFLIRNGAGVDKFSSDGCAGGGTTRPVVKLQKGAAGIVVDGDEVGEHVIFDRGIVTYFNDKVLIALRFGVRTILTVRIMDILEDISDIDQRINCLFGCAALFNLEQNFHFN